MDTEERDLENCQAMIDRCFAIEDYIEDRTVFMENCPPQFKVR